MLAFRGEQEIAIVGVGDAVPVDIGDNEEVGDGKDADGEAVDRDIEEEGWVSEKASFFDRLLLHDVLLGGLAGEAQGLGEEKREGGREGG